MRFELTSRNKQSSPSGVRGRINMKTEFKPNVDLMRAFNSQVMLINDKTGTENGLTLIRAGADGPPIHTHPEQEEHFLIISGQMEVYKKDKWHTLKAGDEVTIPKQTPHSYRSRHSEDCIFHYELTPNRNFSEMMKSFENLQNEGKLKGKDLRSIIYLAMTFRKYKAEVQSVQPPNFVISMMAGIGGLLGFKL